MICPRTGSKLKRVVVDGVELDLSPGCGGVWFDQFELEKFDEVHEAAGDVLIEHMQVHHKDLPNESERLKCPKDPDVVMMRRFYSPKYQIEIDECPQCGGIWLDSEELGAIRKLFPTQQHLKKVGDVFIEKVMNSPEMKAHEAETQAFNKKLEKISNVLWSIVRLGR